MHLPSPSHRLPNGCTMYAAYSRSHSVRPTARNALSHRRRLDHAGCRRWTSARPATHAIARQCPLKTRGVTEAGQTLSSGRGPEIRQSRGRPRPSQSTTGSVAAAPGWGLDHAAPRSARGSICPSSRRPRSAPPPQLAQHPQPNTGAQRQQPLPRCPNQLPQRFLDALGQHPLLAGRLSDRYGLIHGGSSFGLGRSTHHAPIKSGRAEGPPSPQSSTKPGTTSGPDRRRHHRGPAPPQTGQVKAAEAIDTSTIHR